MKRQKTNTRKTVTHRSRTKTATQQVQESDSAYFLKIVLYVLVGSFWLKLHEPIQLGALEFNGIPIGLAIGLLFASHDHFQIDRKIEYALLVVVAIISYFLPSGIVL